MQRHEGRVNCAIRSAESTGNVFRGWVFSKIYEYDTSSNNCCCCSSCIVYCSSSCHFGEKKLSLLYSSGLYSFSLFSPIGCLPVFIASFKTYFMRESGLKSNSRTGLHFFSNHSFISKNICFRSKRLFIWLVIACLEIIHHIQ